MATYQYSTTPVEDSAEQTGNQQQLPRDMGAEDRHSCHYYASTHIII